VKSRFIVPCYEGGSRVARGMVSWVRPETVFVLTDPGVIPPGNGICPQVFVHKNSKASGIGDKTKPFVIESIRAAMALDESCEYAGFFNSDIILPRGVNVSTLLPSSGKRIVFHHRLEMAEQPDGNIAPKAQSCLGKDGFVATKETISDIISGVKDMIVGAPTWDDGLLTWCVKKYGRDSVELRYGEIQHVIHPQGWKNDDVECQFNEKALAASGVSRKDRLAWDWKKEYAAAAKRAAVPEVGIVQPGRIGDIILVLPIAKWFYDRGKKVVWPVPAEYMGMFDNVYYVEPVAISTDIYRASLGILRKRKVAKIIDLGIGFGRDEQDWVTSGLSFDEWKYKAADVPFEERFNLRLIRNPKREAELRKAIGLNGSSDYVVTHSEKSAGWRHDFGQDGSVEVRGIPGFNIFDWIGVIENAKRLYCVDSCVAILANQLSFAKGRRTFVDWGDRYQQGRKHLLKPQIDWENE